MNENFLVVSVEGKRGLVCEHMYSYSIPLSQPVVMLSVYVSVQYKYSLKLRGGKGKTLNIRGNIP